MGGCACRWPRSATALQRHMKNQRLERLRRKMREYHRHHPWRLDGGLFIPHAYPGAEAKKLSWWDDVGFILNGRRVIVWWRHPRCVYHDAIEGTVAKLAMRQPFVLFKGLTFQKLCLPGAFRPGDHHNKMLRPGLCVVHASPQYL